MFVYTKITILSRLHFLEALFYHYQLVYCDKPAVASYLSVKMLKNHCREKF